MDNKYSMYCQEEDSEDNIEEIMEAFYEKIDKYNN
jgi:truncated hemoglobin YjbI